MGLGKNPCFKGEPGSKRGNRDESLVLADDAFSLVQLLSDDVTEDTPVFVLEEVLGTLDFLGQSSWNNGEGDDLRVRMFQRGPGRHAVVLEHEHMAKPHIPSQIRDSFTVGPQDVGDGGHGQRGQALLMTRGLDNDLVGPDPVHLVVNAFSLPVELSFDAEGWKLVWNDAKGPPGLVRGRSIVPEGEDFWGSLILVSLAKRTESTGRSLGLHNKIGRSSSSLRGDNHPSPVDGIFSKFRHNGFSLWLGYRRGGYEGNMILGLVPLILSDRSFCSSSVLHSMQSVVTGLAMRRFSEMGLPHDSQIP